MKKRKLVSIVLLTALTLSMLAACSNDNSSSAAANGSRSGGDVAEEKTHKISILASDPNNPAIRWDDREEYPVYQKLKEMLDERGIELEVEIVPVEQYEVVLQTRMAAGNNLPDIVNVSVMDNASVLSLAKQGIVQPLTKHIEEYSNGNIGHMYTEVYKPGYPLITTADDEVYWLTNLHMKTYQDKPAPEGLAVMIRQDWLDKLEIPMPTTLEEYDAALRAFREQDANGNGAADEILYFDISEQGVFNNSMAQWFGLGNGLFFIDPVNKQVNSPWYQDSVKEYFTYFQGLVNDGIIDPAVIGSADLATQRKAENKVASLMAYGTAAWLRAEVTAVDDADYEPMMPVSALEGVSPIAIKEPAELVWDKYVVTNACDDVEGVIKLFDMVYSEEYATLCAWGLEDESYTVVDGIQQKLPVGSSEEQAANRISTGGPLWGGILPRVQLMNAESSLVDTNLTDIQKEFLLDVIPYEPWVPYFPDNYLAMPTDEETETINKLTTALNTYSDELSIKLVLGQSSLDDWDSYMAEFEELGLKELVAVQQARLDRFYTMMG